MLDESCITTRNSRNQKAQAPDAELVPVVKAFLSAILDRESRVEEIAGDNIMQFRYGNCR